MLLLYNKPLVLITYSLDIFYRKFNLLPVIISNSLSRPHRRIEVCVRKQTLMGAILWKNYFEILSLLKLDIDVFVYRGVPVEQILARPGSAARRDPCSESCGRAVRNSCWVYRKPS